MKKFFISFFITIIVGGIIFLLINNFIGKDGENNEEKNTNSNVVEDYNGKEIVSIDYDTYQQLRSEMYEKDVFAIAIIASNDETSDTYRKELSYSFKNRKTTIYEIDTSKLSEVELSSVIQDVTDIMGYDKPSIITPTLLISKKGKVKGYPKLKYSIELIEILNKNEIE